MVALLCVCFPALAKTRDGAKGTLCLANLRQLQTAWQMYADENNGKLIGNERFTGLPWAPGFMTWDSNPDNTNILNLRSPDRSGLAIYLSSSNNIHKCPADVFQSQYQRSRRIHRVRSYAMNSTVGRDTIPFHEMYKVAASLDDLTIPSPAESTVFLEEHPDWLTDSVFQPSRNRSEWLDLPGNLHDGAAAFSFADGHAELHLWRSTALRSFRVRYMSSLVPFQANHPADLAWMIHSSQRRTKESF
jgi:prepilin-type processing-associated H-X9-DG protein